MDPVRIGHVRYLNTWPLVEGVDRLPSVSLVPAVPADLLGLLTRGEVDVALVSTADLARSATSSSLALLRCGMIGSAGPTLTVQLFSRVPFASITTLHADAESHTSVALCKLLLSQQHGCTPEVKQYSIDPGNWPESVLMIGDKVMTTPPPPGEYAHTMDLGQAWHQWTGLPMVFAVWACRADRAADLVVRTASDLLDRQRRHNATRLPRIAAARAGEHGWTVQTALSYITDHLRYDLDQQAIEGLSAFLDRCAQSGILPHTTLHWAQGGHGAHEPAPSH